MEPQEQQQVEQQLAAIEQAERQQAIEQEPSNFVLTDIEKIIFELLSIVLGEDKKTLEEFIRISRKYDKLKISVKLRATT